MAYSVKRELAAVAKSEPVPDRGVVTSLNALAQKYHQGGMRAYLLNTRISQLDNSGREKRFYSAYQWDNHWALIEA